MRMISNNFSSLVREQAADSHRAGYALLEMLVYIVVFAAAVQLLISLLGTGSRLAALTTLSLNRMDGLREVQDDFTHYTRRAVAVEESVGDYVTGEDRLVLRMPKGLEEDLDYLVLGRLHDNDRFGVLGLANRDGSLENVYLKTLNQPFESLRFNIDREGISPVVTMVTKIKLEDGERERPMLVHQCTAVPRGIAR